MADSKALLSQNEIDALVSFLTTQEESVDKSILSQESIDKLIDMVNHGMDPHGLLDDKNEDEVENHVLLEQTEIDALISMLSNRKDEIDNVVLSQAKIDKLVEMLKNQEK